ncbi:MAG: DUF2889 domain-containing protein [Halobacteriota archaeon]|nr:DUF2889 domain-containing protein [Halobacteriota archaeon]
MILNYTRNKHTTVQDINSEEVLVRSIVDDTYFGAEVEMVVRKAGLKIVSIDGKIKRSFDEKCEEAVSLLQKAVGLHIGSGITKTLTDLIGGAKGCPRLADLILECCDDIILRFTVDQLGMVLSRVDRVPDAVNKTFLKANPRLKNSCIIFAED